MPIRNASATWEGGLQGGNGTFESESGAIGGAYTAGSRFGDSPGTNPEELLAAAEAACFSMALAANLEKAGTAPERIRTQAACTIEKVGEGYKVTTIRLKVRARVPGAEASAFQQAAEKTRTTCPVSQALAGVRIEVEAELE